MIPIVLTVAGSDSSAGAGIQADLKTFFAHRVYGLTAITAVVSEIPGVVDRIIGMPCDMVESQLRLACENYPVKVVKSGMLYQRENVMILADYVRRYQIPLIVDPVLIASSGDSLAEEGLVDVMHEELLPLALLATPNVDELEALTGHSISNEKSLICAAQKLAKRHGIKILAKGGHLNEMSDCVDYLVDSEGVMNRLSSIRLENAETHGTGCTLSSAVAANVALGKTIGSSVYAAKQFVFHSMNQVHSLSDQGIRALNLWDSLPKPK